RLRRLAVEVRLCLADGRLLQQRFRLEAGEGRLTRPDDRGRAIDRGAKIAIVQPDERLPGADISVIRDQDFRDKAGYVRRYRGDIAAGVGVVGAFDELPDAPP